MKNTKRLAIVILSLVLLASSALLVLAACSDNCKVTLDYDSSQGTVSLSVAQNGTAYVKGESVTVTVTAANGYKVSSFSVTGYADAALTNGQYTFVIESNTTVKVTFEALTGNYYTVTVQADEGAIVTLSPAPVNGNMYQEGTLVTATLQLDDGYNVGTCYVDNGIVRFTNNQYSFTVLHDTLVEVSAYRAIPTSVLESLRGNIMFAGTVYTRSQINGGEPTTQSSYEFFSMYDADRQLVRQSEGDAYEEFGCDDQGYAAWPTHGYDGKLEWLRLTDEDGNSNLPFTSYFNPFEYLTIADFIFVEYGVDGEDGYDSVWSLSATTAQNVLRSITGHTYEVETLDIVVIDGVATEIIFRSTSTRVGPVSMYTIGEFAVTHDIDDYAFDDDILLDEYPKQTELEEALANAAAAGAFKVEHTYSDSTYTGYEIYFDGDVVWIAGDDYSYGYLVRPDGMVWDFSFVEGSMVLGDSAVAADMMDVVATFDLLGVSPSMFKHVGNGRYVMRDHDLNGPYYEDLVYYTSMSFATGADEQTEFYYFATNIAIILDSNGQLYQVEVYYYDLDASYNIVENAIVLTFSEFGTATIPDEVEIKEDVVNGIISADYLGVWICDDPYMRVDVALDTVTIDGVASTSVTQTADKTYEVVVDGQKHTLTFDADGTHAVLDGKTLRLRECDWEDLFGTYSGKDQYDYAGLAVEDNLTLTVTANGVTFTIITYIEGIEVYSITKTIGKADLLYTEAYGDPMLLFSYEDDGEELMVLLSLLAKSVVNFYVTDGYSYYYDINAYTDDYNRKDWSIFVGSYADGDNTLTIAADKITIYYNGQTLEFGASDVTYYAVEYVMPVFEMMSNSTVYTLQQYGGTTGKIQLYIGSTLVATFVSDNYQMARWDSFAGTYENYIDEDDDTTVSYRVEITADGLTLWIGEDSYTANITDFDVYLFSDGTSNFKLYSFSFTCVEGDETVEYWLRQYDEGVDYIWELGYEGETIAFVVLELVEDDAQAPSQD